MDGGGEKKVKLEVKGRSRCLRITRSGESPAHGVRVFDR
jgi:hypothetical protein